MEQKETVKVNEEAQKRKEEQEKGSAVGMDNKIKAYEVMSEYLMELWKEAEGAEKGYIRGLMLENDLELVKLWAHR